MSDTCPRCGAPVEVVSRSTFEWYEPSVVRYRPPSERQEQRGGNGMSRTVYSDKVPGEKVNYEWAVRFDKSTGVVGITQFTDPSGATVDRVLLLKAEVQQAHAAGYRQALEQQRAADVAALKAFGPGGGVCLGVYEDGQTEWAQPGDWLEQQPLSSPAPTGKEGPRV